MKHLLTLCAFLLLFSSCEKEDNDYLDSAIATRDIETINALVDSFDPSTINTNQLIDDLTNGTLYCTYVAHNYHSSKWAYSSSWDGGPGPRLRVMLNPDNSAYRGSSKCTWGYNESTQEIIIDSGIVVDYYKISYYKFPYLVIDEYFSQNQNVIRFAVNLKKMSREEFMKLYEIYQ